MAQGEDNQSEVADLRSQRTAAKPNVSLNVSAGHWALVCGSARVSGKIILQRKCNNLELAEREGGRNCDSVDWRGGGCERCETECDPGQTQPHQSSSPRVPGYKTELPFPPHLSPPPATMKITLALLSLAAAASAYPMFLLEEEPMVYRAPRQMPIQDRMPGLGGRRSDDLQPAADTAYGGPPVSILLL